MAPAGGHVSGAGRGGLGPKDLFAWQANQPADRLTRPLVRRDGRLEEASWEEAMGMVVERSQALPPKLAVVDPAAHGAGAPCDGARPRSPSAATSRS